MDDPFRARGEALRDRVRCRPTRPDGPPLGPDERLAEEARSESPAIAGTRVGIGRFGALLGLLK